LAVAAGVLAGLGACSSSASGPALNDGTLQVVVPQSSYSRSALDASSGGAGIHAQVVSTTDLYARVGDAFNGAIEQDPVYVVMGSDAELQRQENGSWVPVAVPVMVEGVRAVLLRAGHTYALVAHANPPIATGVYRLVIKARATANAAAPVAQATSATFEVR
jgi:hypothetical protein